MRGLLLGRHGTSTILFTFVVMYTVLFLYVHVQARKGYQISL